MTEADFYADFEATKARIKARVDGWIALCAEKDAALRWCRANGYPHLKEAKVIAPTQDQIP